MKLTINVLLFIMLKYVITITYIMHITKVGTLRVDVFFLIIRFKYIFFIIGLKFTLKKNSYYIHSLLIFHPYFVTPCISMITVRKQL